MEFVTSAIIIDLAHDARGWDDVIKYLTMYVYT